MTVQGVPLIKGNRSAVPSELITTAMTSKRQRAIKRRLAISLIATATLVAMPIGHAEPTSTEPATIAAERSNQPGPDVEGMIEEAEELRLQGNYVEAAAIWQQLLTIAEEQLGPDDPAVALSLNNLATLLGNKGQFAAAEMLHRRSLAIHEKARGPDHPDVATSLNNLAILLNGQGQHGAAEPLYRRSLKILEKAFGPDHPNIASSLNNLAELLNNQGQYGAAESLVSRALSIQEKAFGPDHPDVAISLNNLAELLRRQGQLSASEPLYRRALAINEKAFGLDHPFIALSLNNLAGLLRDQGQYIAAELLYRRSLAIRERALGTDHPYVAASLNNLAWLLSNKGDYSASEHLYHRALAINEKVFGPDHPYIALNLNNLAGLLRDQGQYTAAEPLYRRSLEIREKTLGLDHPDVAASLNNLAAVLVDQGQYRAAEPLSRRSLAIREKSLGPDHPDVAHSLNNLAEMLRIQGQFNAAEPIYRRSLAIREKTLGPDHPDIASSLINLAALLYNQGHFRAAERLLHRALSIQEKTLGTDHPGIATSLNNLALLLTDQGQPSVAEPLYRRSLDIREKIFGRDHPVVGTSLNNLALFMSGQGQHSAAELLYRRALTIQEKNLGSDHPDIASTLNNLANTLVSKREYEEAESLHRRSLAIREKALGPDHHTTAANFNSLGWLRQIQAQFTQAETLYRRALSITERSLGPDHPEVASILNNLAMPLSDQGHYNAAEVILHRSLAIKGKALGSDHPTVAITLNNLTLALINQGRHASAIRTLRQSLAIESAWLVRELPLLPDQARQAQIDELYSLLQVLYGWISGHLPAANLALEARLNRQGLLQEIEQRQTMLLNAPGMDLAKVEQLKALTQQLSSVTLSAERRAAVRKQRDALLAEIYRLQPDLQIQTVTIADVANTLPPDGALVEIQRYRPWNAHQPPAEQLGEPQYIALVLKPNGDISAVPLGPAADMDAKVHNALSAFAQNLPDAAALWAQLSDQLLKPLLPQLSGSRQWFLSPDGELNRVPFAALPAPQQPNQPLAAAVQLRVLTTGRDLVRLQNSTTRSQASLVMANPSFDRAGRSTALASANGSQPGGQARSADLGSTRWEPLPGTKREGEQVASLLGARLLSGPAATATALKQQQSPRVLHVATHGFFLADQNNPPTDPLRVVPEETAFLSALRQEGPLLRSGLVLAGANQPAADPNDDGHLTAAEILMINLRGTELVVLSACSTGQGEVRTGEGVYGLQRALTVAGARSTLLSLWKVDDAATAEFMARFYQRLKAGEGRAAALAAVQAEFRSGAVTSPSGDDWSEPYHWAAWQLTGDWGPIPGL